MSNTTEQVFNLKVGELFLIKEVTGAAGWATSINDIYLAGKVISEVFPELSPVKNKDELNLPAPEFKLTTKQLEVVKKAIKYSVEKGQLFPGPYVVTVLEVFKLVD